MSSTRPRRPVLAAAALVGALSLTACGDAAQDVEGAATDPGAGSGATATPDEGGDDGDDGATGAASGDEPVLQVEQTGGFTTPEMLATRLPMLTVYADGRVFSPAPQIEVYPGPALPAFEVRTLAPDQVDQLVQLALDAGVDDNPDLGDPPIADAPTTRFTVRTDEAMYALDAYALYETDPSMGAPPDMVTEEQQQARARLVELAASLTDLSGALGDAESGASELYEPEAIAAVHGPYTADPAAEGLTVEEKEWPGPALGGSEAPADGAVQLDCVVVEGDELQPVLDAAAQASTLTPWLAGGEQWQVAFRPMLPHEETCEDIAPEVVS